MTAALEISDLKKTYPGGVEALKGIHLTVNEGDFFALLGPNGAGKSTAIGVITSLVNKTAGKVRVFGVDTDDNFPLAKTHIGLVPQEFNFHIFEKVEQIVVQQAGYYGVPRKLAKQRAEYYLKKLHLWDKRDTQAKRLSGGMKRRLMIARALVHDPKLLILDEPTAGVDIEIRRSMWAFMKELNAQGVTIILTTHYLEEAESLCRNIAIINHGEIIENSSMHSLLDKIKKQTILLTVSRELTEAPVLSGFPCCLIDAYTLEVELCQTLNFNHLLAALSEKDIHVLSMRNKTNRLEELFVELTSRQGE